MTKIDWTKPIEYIGIDGMKHKPVTLIGRDGDLYVVKIDRDYYSYTEDGWNDSRTFRLIANVPPPKVESTFSVLLFRDGSYGVFSSDHRPITGKAIARKVITITEGEGM